LKGFKDSNNKFHPITQSKGVRKSRDQSTKTQGVKLVRKARTVSKVKRLPDVSINNENFSFRVDEGKIHLSLDDFMWRWSGEEDQLNGFLARMAGTGAEAWDDLADGLKDAGIKTISTKKSIRKTNTRK